jgi:hypothetical protein
MKLPAARPQAFGSDAQARRGIFSPNVLLFLIIAAFHPRGKTAGYSSGFEINLKTYQTPLEQTAISPENTNILIELVLEQTAPTGQRQSRLLAGHCFKAGEQ